MTDGSTPETRLFVEAPLEAGGTTELPTEQAHFLRNVLRLAPGAPVALFNGRDGEWLGRVAVLGKSSGSVALERQLQPQSQPADLWLLFAPIKRGRVDFLVEKATELGVSVLQPVWTRRTVVERVNLDRLRAHAVEAAEQTGRLDVPELREPLALDRLIDTWPQDRRLMLCDESGRSPLVTEALAKAAPGPWAILTGPEGGFTETELDGLRKLPFVCGVGLGPRILRADTAALAALAVFQAIRGDWPARSP